MSENRLAVDMMKGLQAKTNCI